MARRLRGLAAPGRKGSLWAELPLWEHATPEQRRVLYDATTLAHTTAEENRALVLRHPDLAQRLVDVKLYRRPDQWNGYVPPHTAYITLDYVAVPNRSPVRAFLLDLIAEARARESAR